MNNTIVVILYLGRGSQQVFRSADILSNLSRSDHFSCVFRVENNFNFSFLKSLQVLRLHPCSEYFNLLRKDLQNSLHTIDLNRQTLEFLLVCGPTPFSIPSNQCHWQTSPTRPILSPLLTQAQQFWSIMTSRFDGISV